jgi:Fe/S biogenesis protein NfuA
MIELSEPALRALPPPAANPRAATPSASAFPPCIRARPRRTRAWNSASRDLQGDEWSLDCQGFALYVDSDSAPWLDGAQIDYASNATGGQLTIRAPKIKGQVPGDGRERWPSACSTCSIRRSTRCSPRTRAASRSSASTTKGAVYLRFGGGCHGCGMVDVTLKNGIEKTLRERIPEVTAVRDATDHATGAAPYIPR